ncbi:hypothetical protein PGTUg99_037032 [Puccinia graminis f. sp. tritici]|uniref:Uncharacterized protein n=1 Tax=Puccinia graminis f. sp. tritici TaxID=56615 RepID=A0A5B0RJN5_PUCGR|nr:hypothetical protein PGTUg99_037032 [Puccinia graminis f. sp. tritici]
MGETDGVSRGRDWFKSRRKAWSVCSTNFDSGGSHQSSHHQLIIINTKIASTQVLKSNHAQSISKKENN